MINAKELMIDNLILYPSPTGNLITQVGPHLIRFFHENATQLEYIPIEITDNVLEACEFKKGKGNLPSYYMSITVFEEQYKVLYFSGDYLFLREGCINAERGNDDIFVVWNKDIKGKFYLHQLQNLYMSITGTSLNIDINKLKITW